MKLRSHLRKTFKVISSAIFIELALPLTLLEAARLTWAGLHETNIIVHLWKKNNTWHAWCLYTTYIALQKDKDDSSLFMLTLKSRTILFNSAIFEEDLVRQLIFPLINQLQFIANLEFRNGCHKFTSNFEMDSPHIKMLFILYVFWSDLQSNLSGYKSCPWV